MTKLHSSFDNKTLSTLQRIVEEGMSNAAQGFSGMLGETLTVSRPSVEFVAMGEIPMLLGGPEDEAVGIYLRAEGNLTGQIMLVIPLTKAYELVDLLMGNPDGVTNHLGSLERSALAEVGNITGTFFLNRMADLTKTDVRPTPPAVIVDMVGAILDIIVTATGGVSEQVVLLKTTFTCGQRQLAVNFWVVPDPGTFESLSVES